MREFLIIGLFVLAIFAVAAVALFWNRFAMPFQEETRRITYQESVTAQTACRANLSRLYEDWATAGPTHKKAIEAMAIDESRRYRCEELNPLVQQWIGTLR